MTIDFENESSTALDLDLYEIAQDVVSCALDYMECPLSFSITQIRASGRRLLPPPAHWNA